MINDEIKIKTGINIQLRLIRLRLSIYFNLKSSIDTFHLRLHPGFGNDVASP